MRLRPPHFANTLLFRISATFLLLMGICLGGYYLWIESSVFNPFADELEKDWYENLAEEELGALSARLATCGADRAAVAAALGEYGERARGFKAEVIVFDGSGRNIASSDPDSLGAAVAEVSADLLRRMSGEEWDFSTYPEPNLADAYENRIFEVDPIAGGPGDAVAGYLAASFFPVSVVSDDLNADSRMINAQTRIFKVMMGMLIYSAVTALLIMAWTGRRVQRLSSGVEEFAAGNLAHRVHVRNSDEIGVLGANFNHMAERIETMVEKLRQKEQFQRQLIANVSHDLRTPLASMRGYVDTLLMGAEPADPAEQERYLKIIAGNLDHLDRLVEHTLVLSRFDSGQATFQFEDFPLSELADSVIGRLEGLATRQQITLSLEAGPGVGIVHADPLQIGQVLQNLLENGIKFNRPGGKVATVLSAEGDKVAVEVKDDGIGITEADLPQVFDRFFTGDPSRHRQADEAAVAGTGHRWGQSAGLGLAIAARITAGHGSELTVASGPGQGATFRFMLAAAVGDDQDFAPGS